MHNGKYIIKWHHKRTYDKGRVTINIYINQLTAEFSFRNVSRGLRKRNYRRNASYAIETG